MSTYFKNKRIYFVLFTIILFSCTSDLDKDIFLEEKEILDGTVIDLVHINGCKEFDADSWFVRKEKKIEYIRRKGQVFCFCIHEDECKMLMAISYRNAKKWFAWDFAYNTDNHDKSANRYAEVIDTISSPHEVWFSEKDNGDVIEQSQHKIYKSMIKYE